VAQYRFNKTLGVQEDSSYDITANGLSEDSGFITLLTPSPKSPPPPYEKVEEIALKHRLDIIIAQKEIEVAKRNITLAERQRIPDIGLLGAYSYTPAARNNDPDTQGRTIGGAIIGAGMDLPVLYTYRPEIKIAKTQLQQRELALKTARVTAIAEVKSAYANFELAQKNLNFYSDNLLGESELVLKASEKSYEVGKSDLSTLILMQQARLSILASYVDALISYYSSWIDLLRAVNTEDLG
jgi:cobalt-zinc-cadmium efflux system outer membrane protein